ncbi:hypothetical protein [Hymenobacter coccineus]|uniref:Uncharacterized protein n=1 Tax=Hymenobacter coccineus TaxID=1908235 RepID=A0A1G1SV11_9BACT|nr:hypothetical protein [Hymenobacter coccineus]OGX82461.1 hypothetical protein BEN49_13935 [Hymenobacter coccineus]
MGIVNKGLRLLMGACYAFQAYKGEIGRLKASILLGLFISLPSTAFVMAGIWASHVSAPDWLLIITPIATVVLGDKLANACYQRVPFAVLSLQGINKLLLISGLLLVLAAMLVLSFLLTLVNILKS